MLPFHVTVVLREPPLRTTCAEVGLLTETFPLIVMIVLDNDESVAIKDDLIPILYLLPCIMLVSVGNSVVTSPDVILVDLILEHLASVAAVTVDGQTTIDMSPKNKNI